MQATIYISPEAMTTISVIKDMDYYDRVSLSDDPTTDLTKSPGYYLNINALNLAKLPVDAEVVIRLTPADAATYQQHVRIKSELRGVIFSGAPNLPNDYAKIIAYWSPLIATYHHRGAVYYQNVLNSYCVQLVDPDGMEDAVDVNDAEHATDFLVSDGLVVTVTGLALNLEGMNPQQFVALTIPINPTMLGIEMEGYHSEEDYSIHPAPQMETLYLRIADILASPDVNHIEISAVRTELFDYGYTY
ncbi:hypothetical protein [Duganella vulcania]|uniref:Uncharacterized protein n=1 Tax=Duganella vulcania TaxID=2692166 RepID=A0A845GUY6_9BURK|nr:hypothetical protein [Duganella vulcania]MYM96487.1 hypothetical protein [Duganella vulcania]